jgi:hypothetical protein
MTTEKQYSVDITLKVFLQEFRLVGAPDWWASSMDAWFEACSHIWWRGIHVPSKYQYSPGMGSDPREPDSYFHDLCNEASDEALMEIAEFLFRYCQLLKHHGKDY